MARLKRNHPLPLYVQLLETLRADILCRRLQPHQQLPSERELGDRFHVSRMTVRQALADLSRDGFIYTRVGKGTFVSEPKINQQLKTLTGFSQDMEKRGSKPSSRILEATLERATDSIAKALHISPGTEVVLLSRVRLSDSVPLAIEIVHLPHSLCPNLLRNNFAVESLYNVLERDYGFRLTRAEQTIEAALCNAHEPALLQLTPPAPVLVMERLTFTDHDIPIEHVHSVYRGDRYKFHSTLAPRSESQERR
jgi:GntR family transcriptional regulator